MLRRMVVRSFWEQGGLSCFHDGRNCFLEKKCLIRLPLMRDAKPFNVNFKLLFIVYYETVQLVKNLHPIQSYECALSSQPLSEFQQLHHPMKKTFMHEVTWTWPPTGLCIAPRRHFSPWKGENRKEPQNWRRCRKVFSFSLEWKHQSLTLVSWSKFCWWVCPRVGFEWYDWRVKFRVVFTPSFSSPFHVWLQYHLRGFETVFFCWPVVKLLYRNYVLSPTFEVSRVEHKH